MDFNKLLKNVKNVDEYISVTQKICDMSKDTKVQINITTVLALKKIKSLEIEYLNKCYENGAACFLFERLLSIPPSKTWGVLGKELVSLLQYWLDAIRKYLISHCVQWWSFLKLILKFIKEICLKDLSMPNILVELTAECLFDIASRDNPDSQQRHEILHCLNVISAESSREIRFALRNKFGDYFTKLASLLATCGYFPCQYSALEALVRWLVPRQDSNLRAAAAARWFPGDLCPEAARDVFLNTNWMNFFQDSREFLNALNEANGLVTSVVCRRLTIGKIIVVSGAEKQQIWLDINSNCQSISILLDPKVLVTLGILGHRACETLLFAGDDTQEARLHSESKELTVSLKTYRPPRVLPSDITTGDACDVSIVVSSRIGVGRLDAGLRNVFGDKYHLLMDLNREISLSPPRSRDVRRNQNTSEEDTRFSHPVEVRRRKHTGYIVRSIKAGGLVSPSTASTSSLAQLHDKLAALPRYKYDKEPVSVCVEPQLSSVTEITESDNRSFRSMSTLKLRQFGVCHKNLTLNSGLLPKATKNKADSDTEILKLKPKLDKRISSVVRDESSTSCLLVATVGSADDSVISDTVERLSKSKDFKNDNIVDLLVQEALQAKPTKKENLIDSGINSGDKKSQGNEDNSEAIENTPIRNKNKNTARKTRIAKKKICTVVSKSTTDDESNTETINETPAFPNIKNKKLSRRQSIFQEKQPEPKVADKQSFDVQTVEQFFSQHFSETEAGEIVISPSLAKKINESSSESSEIFDQNCLNDNENLNVEVEQFEFNDIDIVQCLNAMVDKVCSDFEKCTEYLNKGVVVKDKNSESPKDSKINTSEGTYGNISIEQAKPVSKPAKSIKLTFKAMKGKKAVTKKGKKDIEQNPNHKMSTIIEQKDEEAIKNNSPEQSTIKDVDIPKMNSPITKENKSLVEKDETTSITKKKRKLYSPKDDEIEKERKGIKIPEKDDDDIVLSKLKTYNRTKAPKTFATCYKEIEKERKRHIRLPRSKKSRSKVEDSPSPRTLKMNAAFDELKATVESIEKHVVAEKKYTQSDVYNFTSDSDDEDFKKKKIEVQKQTSTTTLGSLESAKSGRPGRPRTRLNYTAKSSNHDAKKTNTTKRKKAVKKTNSKSKEKINIEPVTDLNDEKMRKTGPEDLNSSIIIEKPKTKRTAKPELDLQPPEMEPISNDQESVAPVKRKPSKKTKNTEILSIKKEKGKENNELKSVSDKEDDRTVSPLPGLVVESIPARKDDTNEFMTTMMIQKFKKLYKEGTDAINDSSNTQNMLLSDADRCCSPQNVFINITDEICFVGPANKNKQTVTERKKSTYKRDQVHKLSKNDRKITAQKTSLSKEISGEVIETSEIPDNESEKSIATVGITAHGDFDEVPPSPEMIRERMQPREIEDLNESMKDYFVKLNREIYDSTCQERRESSNSKNAEISKVIRPVFERSPSVKSPVVSVHRLSFDDISKWLPSRRTSFTSGSEKSSPKFQEKSETVKVKQQTKTHETKNASDEMQKHEQMKSRPDKTVVDIPKVKSPIVPISAISLEEFNNWFPMPKSFEPTDDGQTKIRPLHKDTKRSNVTLVYNTRQKSKTIENIKIPSGTKEKNYRKMKTKTEPTQCTEKNNAKAIESKHTNITGQDLISNMISSRNTTKNISVGKKIKGKVIKNTDDSDSDGNAERQAVNKRSFETNNTIISPIRCPDEIVPYAEINDESDDTCIKKIRQVFSKERVKSKTLDVTKSTQEIQSLDTTSTKIQSQNSTRNIQTLHSASTKLKEKSEWHDSASTKVEESFKRPMKRNSPPILNEPKRGRFEPNIETVTIESGPSISSVDDWFRRIEPSTGHAKDTRLPFRDLIQNIMEKLDTTLVENNRNTSKKLINLFVEAQTQLTTQQEEKREMYKSVAKQIVTEIVSIMDEKFSDLDRRSQQMETEFKEQLKKQAFDLIREDCDQKRAMVCLLKEDVQAVLDYIEKGGALP